MKYVCGIFCLLALATGVGAIAAGMAPNLDEGRNARNQLEIIQMIENPDAKISQQR